MAGLTCMQRRAPIRGQLVPTAHNKATAAAQQHTGRHQCRHRGQLAQVGARRGQDGKPNWLGAQRRHGSTRGDP
eukprot:8527900-Pyramimonas_sp.AAC.1